MTPAELATDVFLVVMGCVALALLVLILHIAAALR